jgi:hypothetical protein
MQNIFYTSVVGNIMYAQEEQSSSTTRENKAITSVNQQASIHESIMYITTSVTNQRKKKEKSLGSPRSPKRSPN